MAWVMFIGIVLFVVIVGGRMARKSRARRLEDAVLHSWLGRAELKVDREVKDPVYLRAMMEVVGDLANADFCGLAALKALPDATYRPPSGSWDQRSAPAIEIEVQGTVVSLQPVRLGDEDDDDVEVTTSAVAHGIRSNENLDLTIGGDSDAELPEEASAHDAGPGHLVCKDGTATFTWSSLETDPKRLQAGARLVAYFASPAAEGAFR